MAAEKASIKTAEVPGPKSVELGKLKEKYISKAIGLSAPVYIDRAEGSLFYDIDGNVLIDMGSGIGVTNVGHCPKEVVKAIQDQAEKFLHLCFMVTPYEDYVRLCEKLANIAPHQGLVKSVLYNSGAEAVENSVKISRHFTKKPAAFSFVHAFHGRTFPSCGVACADKIDEVWSSPQFQGKVACLIGEPIAGEGGFIVPPKEFYAKVTKICKKHGVIYVDDEIQTGAGRTGKMWAVQHWPGVEPDMLVSGKGIGGGFPVSATTSRPDIMDAPQVGGLGGTFGGNPVACAAALAQFDIIERAMDNVPKINAYMTKRLKEMQSKYPVIGDIRGMGAMMAMELVSDQKTKTPAAKEAKATKVAALKKGMVLLTCGTLDNVIRLHPSMVMPDELLEQAMGILDESLGEATRAQ
jgi:4-aminobutyrate aminotransferase/(S)-3-amino-2-methylpropionate transaminase